MTESFGRAAKERFTALDVRALASELRRLDRPRVDKAFDYADRGWIVSLRAREEGRRDLVLEPGRFGALVDEGPPHPERPGPFATQLRRHLAGALLLQVPDPAGERTLTVEFGPPEGRAPITLVVELFGTGNLVLVAEGKVLAAARARSFATRSLRPGAEYRAAPGRPDPFASLPERIAGLLRDSTADRVSTLAARVGFGGPLAEELLARSGLVGGTPATEEADSAAIALVAAARGLLDEVDRSPQGFLYFRGDTPIDVTPFAARRRSEEPGVRSEPRPSFGRAAFEYFDPRPVMVADARTRADTGESRLLRLRERQSAAVGALRAEAELRSAEANRLLERFSEAEAARKAMDPEGPEEGEVVLGDLTVTLRRDESPERTARRLFEEGKRVKTKLAGATAALSETETALAKAPSPARPSEGPARPAAEAGPPAWYERFRWFLSSEAILVLGGRDAASNDLLVKKHLRPGDRYVHGDIHGAASVVVKRSETNGPEPGPTTMLEAGQFAVAYSKAWRAGHASADAFWVLPEQVSKTAASGEFVARGAWVIHGTKQVLRDLPLELAIGTQESGGRPRWTVGPPSALRAAGTVRYLLTPGEERRRAEIEIELARELGLPRPRLQSLLPAGGLNARRA